MKLRLKHTSNLVDLTFTIDDIIKVTECNEKKNLITAQIKWSQDGLDKLKALDYEFSFMSSDGKLCNKVGIRYIIFHVPINRLIQITN